MAHKDLTAKKRMARQLLFGDGVDKDEAKAVPLLEDCVAHGDTDAMVMLAKCCAYGLGTEHNTERAESLLSKAAEKGHIDAYYLMDFINSGKEEQTISYQGLQSFCSVDKNEKQ